jgi:hypothetical protein
VNRPVQEIADFVSGIIGPAGRPASRTASPTVRPTDGRPSSIATARGTISSAAVRIISCVSRARR